MASSTDTCDLGLIGLAVMGENLVLNMESKGFSVAVFNRTTSVTEKFAVGRASGKRMPGRSSRPFSPRSRHKSRVSLAAATWDRTARGIT